MLSGVAVRQLPLVLAAGAAAVSAWRTDGSIAAADWLPVAVLAALVLAVLAAGGAPSVLPPAAAVGAGGLVLLAALAAASTAWSPSPAGARDEALLTGFYAIALLAGALATRARIEREPAIAAVTAVLAVLATATAFDLALSSRPESLLFGGRLDFPVSYVNADAALFMLGFWPAVAVAARRNGSLAVRSGGAAAAALFLALGVAAQSKGAVVGIVVSAVMLFALAPVRLRVFVPTLLAAIAVAPAARPLTAPYRSDAAAAAHRAGWAALVVAVVAAVLGAAYALADRRLALDEGQRRFAGRGVLALVVACIVVGVAAFAIEVPTPGSWAAAKWRAFKHPPAAQSGSTHLTSLGSNRYDFWRVAIQEARAHPLAGIGGRGFFTAYLREGHSGETPLRAHSLYLDTVAEEGLSGLVLLLVGLGGPLVLLRRRLREPAGVAAFGAGIYFFAHAAVDWIWTVPVVGLFAFLILGAGCGGEEEAAPLRRATAWTLAAAATLTAVFAFAPPWIASRYVAAASAAPDPARDLSHARFFDPLSLDPYWAEWRLAPTPAAAADALVRARKLEPKSVALLYQLALTYERGGRKQLALDALRRAAALAPRDPIVRHALRAAHG